MLGHDELVVSYFHQLLTFTLEYLSMFKCTVDTFFFTLTQVDSYFLQLYSYF